MFTGPESQGRRLELRYGTGQTRYPASGKHPETSQARPPLTMIESVVERRAALARPTVWRSRSLQAWLVPEAASP